MPETDLAHMRTPKKVHNNLKLNIFKNRKNKIEPGAKEVHPEKQIGWLEKKKNFTRQSNSFFQKFREQLTCKSIILWEVEKCSPREKG